MDLKVDGLLRDPSRHPRSWIISTVHDWCLSLLVAFEDEAGDAHDRVSLLVALDSVAVGEHGHQQHASTKAMSAVANWSSRRRVK